MRREEELVAASFFHMQKPEMCQNFESKGRRGFVAGFWSSGTWVSFFKGKPFS